MIEFHGTGIGKYVMDPESRDLFLRWGASIKGRWGLRPFRISPKREVSQNNAHFERCEIIGQEVGLTAHAVSDILMEDAFIKTQNPCYGQYKNVFGKEKFCPESTRNLSKDEFWELKRAAYERLKFMNEDKEPENYSKFPERGDNGIIAYCCMWEERPRI